MKFSTCIVRQPCPEMVGGLSSGGLGIPDYGLALEQHKKYVEALEECGCKVIVLPADPAYPDSVFVEDTALLIGSAAILTRPGADSRKGETAGMKPVLQNHFMPVEEIRKPGTLEAGDVLEIESHYYIGISERTNKEGAEQLIRILEKHGKTGSTVRLQKFLHLKTGVAWLGNNTILLAGELMQAIEFRSFKKIEVDDDEQYAANSIMVNGTVIMPAGYPKTLNALQDSGYKVLQVDTSEYRKLDGGLSCLSLRF